MQQNVEFDSLDFKRMMMGISQNQTNSFACVKIIYLPQGLPIDVFLLVQNTSINNNNNSNDKSLNNNNNGVSFHSIFVSLLTNPYKNCMQQIFYVYVHLLHEAGAPKREAIFSKSQRSLMALMDFLLSDLPIGVHISQLLISLQG